MNTLTVCLLLAADPRFLGGAPPTPLNVPAQVDPTPSVQACTVETLRHSSACVFDARPFAPEGQDARKKQSKDNLALAESLGRAVCQERIVPADVDLKEKTRRATACLDNTRRAAATCGLDGLEALLDAEGRFGPRGRDCYQSLAAALQLADVPPEVKSDAKATPGTPSTQKTNQPLKI